MIEGPPRYFVAGSGTPQPATDDPGMMRQVIDTIELHSRDGSQLLVVGTDSGGLPIVTGARQLDLLPQRARAAVSHHEVAHQGRLWKITARELFVMVAESFEQTAGAYARVPVRIHGTLRGPYPSTADQTLSQVTPTYRGQLTVTRADLLTAYRDSSSFTNVDGSACFRLVLPADATEAVTQGTGIVVVYLLPPVEVGASPDNFALLAALIDEVLALFPAPGFFSGLFADPERDARVDRLLKQTAGWPDPRARALRDRVNGHPLPRAPEMPSKPSANPTPAAAPPQPPVVPYQPTERGEWMRDFETSWYNDRKSAQDNQPDPDWRKDFEPEE